MRKKKDKGCNVVVEGDRESNVLHKKLILDLKSEGERVDAEKGRNERKKEGRKEGRSEIQKLDVCLPSHCCSNRINSEVKFVRRNGQFSFSLSLSFSPFAHPFSRDIAEDSN